MQATTGYRVVLARRGRRLEWFTIGCNYLEGLASIVAGAVAGSVSLLAFGIDSAIEVVSGTALLWRMSIDADVTRREQRERLTLRIVATCFIGLALNAFFGLWWADPLAAMIMAFIAGHEGIETLKGKKCH